MIQHESWVVERYQVRKNSSQTAQKRYVYVYPTCSKQKLCLLIDFLQTPKKSSAAQQANALAAFQQLHQESRLDFDPSEP